MFLCAGDFVVRKISCNRGLSQCRGWAVGYLTDDMVRNMRVGGFCCCLAGRSSGASHVNNLSTHNNVYSSSSKKAASGGTAGFKRPEEEVQCSSCKKDCGKQRYYRKQVSVKHLLVLGWVECSVVEQHVKMLLVH